MLHLYYEIKLTYPRLLKSWSLDQINIAPSVNYARYSCFQNAKIDCVRCYLQLFTFDLPIMYQTETHLCDKKI